MLCGAHKSNVKQERRHRMTWGMHILLNVALLHNKYPGAYNTAADEFYPVPRRRPFSLGLVDVCTQTALILLLAVPVEPVFPGKDRGPYFPQYLPSLRPWWL